MIVVVVVVEMNDEGYQVCEKDFVGKCNEKTIAAKITASKKHSCKVVQMTVLDIFVNCDQNSNIRPLVKYGTTCFSSSPYASEAAVDNLLMTRRCKKNFHCDRSSSSIAQQPVFFSEGQ